MVRPVIVTTITASEDKITGIIYWCCWCCWCCWVLLVLLVVAADAASGVGAAAAEPPSGSDQKSKVEAEVKVTNKIQIVSTHRHHCKSAYLSSRGRVTSSYCTSGSDVGRLDTMVVMTSNLSYGQVSVQHQHPHQHANTNDTVSASRGTAVLALALALAYGAELLAAPPPKMAGKAADSAQRWATNHSHNRPHRVQHPFQPRTEILHRKPPSPSTRPRGGYQAWLE
jgi:hypothetical protein